MKTIGQRLMFRPGIEVSVEDFEVPSPGPSQLVVRVTRSQVSAGSELNGIRDLERVGQGQHVGGYTTVGVVEAVGDRVTKFIPGERVLAFGNHASHVLVDTHAVDDWRAFPDSLPDGVTDTQACFSVLGDVALHAVRRGGLQIDGSVAVFGVGVVGQLTVQFARLSGAHPIIAVDLVRSRLDLAQQHGATHIVDASSGRSVARVHELTHGRGAETVFHCSQVAQLMQTTMEAAAERGKVVLTGSTPGTAQLGLQEQLLRRELSIIGVYGLGLQQAHPYWQFTRQRNRAACYRLIESGSLTVDPLVSHLVPPVEAQAMYRMMAEGAGEWMSVVFDWR